MVIRYTVPKTLQNPCPQNPLSTDKPASAQPAR
jgi:hypothetical protein